MNILAIETSGPMLSLAVEYNGTCIVDDSLCQRKHAQFILPKLNALLVKAGLVAADLDLLAVSNGPGSFIGVRTGLTVIKTLAFALNLPIVAVSSLQALAQTIYLQHGCEQVLLAVDARLRAVYTGQYELKSGFMQQIGTDEIMSLDDFKLKLTNYSGIVAGSAIEAYSDLQAYARQRLTNVFPGARAVLEIAKQRYKCESNQATAYSCQPNYMRDKVAQTKLERRQNG